MPMPVLMVSRAAPEGMEGKATKSGKTRRVPVADRVLPLVQTCADGKRPDDLLLTTRTGHQLHASAVKRSATGSAGHRVHGSTTCGTRRRVCGWPRGVAPVTVQAWLGHASIATTNM